MNEKEFQEWQKQCIQEESPECTAACPLHIDVREFVACLAENRLQDAIAAITRTMPFPGLLGRICDAPCESRCVRRDLGGAIRIGCLERFCSERMPPTLKVYKPMAKAKRVAVAGSGLSSLTVALELARKGYPVTIFEPTEQIGSALIERGLSRDVIDRETAVLDQLGVTNVLRADLDGVDFIDRSLASFDAVYLGQDGLPDIDWKLDRDGEGKIIITPKIYATSREGVFAGGQYDSPVWQAASGRWAAVTIDRYLQGISLTAGRDNEGPQATKLYVDVAQVSPSPQVPVADAGAGYNPEEAMREARRCLNCQCLECVKVCRYLETFDAYPKIYIRDILANELMVKGVHKANKLVNSCSLCGLCEVVCPENLPMQDVCLTARCSMVSRKKMPPSAHEIAIQDMLLANSEKAGLALHESGKKESAYLFFPGCQLSAIYPEYVESAYAYLRSALQGGVGLLMRCCAAPAEWAGQKALFKEALHELEQDWVRLGKPKIIVACPTCFKILKSFLPHIERIPLWDLLVDEVANVVKRNAAPLPVLAIHDPCNARHEPAIQESVRMLLNNIGCSVEELALGRDKTECCGFGGGMASANPLLAKDVARTRAARSETDYVTYCAMCRNALAATGKRIFHVLDFFFTKHNIDSANRAYVGFSERRENRYRLKRRLLKELWGKKEGPMAGYEKIVVYADRDVLERMEERRILLEDIQQVIEHAEKTGERFYNSRTGCSLSSFKPESVTYWVEYRREGEGFRLSNVYSHRMEIMGRRKT